MSNPCHALCVCDYVYMCIYVYKQTRVTCFFHLAIYIVMDIFHVIKYSSTILTAEYICLIASHPARTIVCHLCNQFLRTRY